VGLALELAWLLVAVLRLATALALVGGWLWALALVLPWALPWALAWP